jgi:hypothetical protein
VVRCGEVRLVVVGTAGIARRTIASSAPVPAPTPAPAATTGVVGVVEADVLAVAVAERLTELDADAADSDGLDVDGAPHPASRAAAHAARTGAATRTGTSGKLGSDTCCSLSVVAPLLGQVTQRSSSTGPARP